MSESVQTALYLRLLMRCLPARSTYAKSIRMWSTRFASTFHVINFDEINAVLRLRAPPGEKRSGEQS